jgi:hypothetical protein
MSPKIWTAIIYIILMITLLTSAWIAYSAACDYEHQTEIITDRLHTQPKLITLLKWIGEGITAGKIYRGYSQEIEELKAITAARDTYKRHAILATLVFFIVSCVFLGFIYVALSKTVFFLATMLVVSLIALAVGLFAPILMIISYKDIPILGQVVFMFQSKGIVTTIETLWTSGNLLVAIPLFLFSVMIPFFKTIIMGLALLAPDYPIASHSMRLIKHIGKWSMADVFVVALLLTYFTLNRDESTNAEVQIGLYFFLGYVILSMIVSLLLTHGRPR